MATIKPVMLTAIRAGWIDPAKQLWPACVLRNVPWAESLRGTGSRSDPRAPKRYDGERLRNLRAERGVGRLRKKAAE